MADAGDRSLCIDLRWESGVATAVVGDWTGIRVGSAAEGTTSSAGTAVAITWTGTG